MTKEVDARGQACPKPVIMTKKALEALTEGGLRVLVSDLVARSNVERFARSAGCAVTTQELADGTHAVLIERAGTPTALPAVAVAPFVPSCATGSGRAVILIESDRLGRGADELGGVLMKAFFFALAEAGEKPSALVFMNSGVRLTSAGSECLENLTRLESAGVEISSCGTCLDFFGLKEQLKVGRISNMYDIVGVLMAADKVVTV